MGQSKGVVTAVEIAIVMSVAGIGVITGLVTYLSMPLVRRWARGRHRRTL
jgi:hypothetical protein